MEDITNNITGLVKALVQFHRKKPVIKFDKEITYGNKTFPYASLGAILDAITVPLSEVGLAIVQIINDTHIETRLIHDETGASISSFYKMIYGGKAQETGSYITYAKRYSICALLAICGEDDDDGEGASNISQNANLHKLSKNTNPKPKPATTPAETLDKLVTAINSKTTQKELEEFNKDARVIAAINMLPSAFKSQIIEAIQHKAEELGYE